MEQVAAVFGGPPELDGVAPALAEVVVAATGREPAVRPSLSELADRLEATSIA
jgi:hypothetical protein